MPTLSLANVSHDYGPQRVLADFSLTVAAGEVVCLLGPSGCGKSTALRLVAGLEALRFGRIHIEGQLVAGPDVDVPPERRRAGLVFQDHALFPHLDLLANVAFGLNGPDRNQQAQHWLDRVGLASRAAAYPHQLSGGEQQRVALARALAPQPRIMLLDEPFSSLDVGLRADLRRMSLDLLREAGAATVLVTHDPEEALAMADRLAVMRDGRLVQVDMPDEVYRRPVDRFVAGFLGAVNVLPPAFGSNLLCRPEAVRLGHGEHAATVTAARRVGAATVVELQLADGSPLVARAYGNALPAVGDAVRIGIDPAGLITLPVREPA